jgi:hypothetical protein
MAPFKMSSEGLILYEGKIWHRRLGTCVIVSICTQYLLNTIEAPYRFSWVCRMLWFCVYRFYNQLHDDWGLLGRDIRGHFRVLDCVLTLKLKHPPNGRRKLLFSNNYSCRELPRFEESPLFLFPSRISVIDITAYCCIIQYLCDWFGPGSIKINVSVPGHSFVILERLGANKIQLYVLRKEGWHFHGDVDSCRGVRGRDTV